MEFTGEAFSKNGVMQLEPKKSAAKKNYCFVSVGTHPQQFDRLLCEVDALIENDKISGEVFAQGGNSSYVMRYCKSKKFLTLVEFADLLSKCSLFITHAGEGSIGQAKNMGKKMIVVPRRKEFVEHTNNHQLELAQVVQDKKLGLVAWDISELGEKLRQIRNFTPARIERGKIVQILQDYVKREF